MKRCKDCKWFSYFYRIHGLRVAKCYHPTFFVGFDPVDGAKIYETGSCDELNKDLNCELYTRKLLKFWRPK